MKITAEPRSDQINADDFVGSAQTFTIAGVRQGTAEQKYDIMLAEVPGRVWRPPLTVLRLLIEAWGDESDNWVGKRVTLFRDASVSFGRDAVGGIRVSHMSDLPDNKPLKVKLTTKRGKRELFTVQPLPDAPQPAQPTLTDRITQAVNAFSGIGVTVEQITAELGGRTPDAWTDADLTGLLTIFQSIKAGESTAADEFGGESA